jgi:hypothetical protein
LGPVSVEIRRKILEKARSYKDINIMRWLLEGGKSTFELLPKECSITADRMGPSLYTFVVKRVGEIAPAF